MSVIVVGGHSQGVGKTAVVTSLIQQLPEFAWTAIKITQFAASDGSLLPSFSGQSHTDAESFTEERDSATERDTSRFLRSGAKRALWVTIRQGQLARSMARLRKEITAMPYVVVESNSVMGFMNPDLYLFTFDSAKESFKDSARFFLDRVDAVLTRGEIPSLPGMWGGVSLDRLSGKPMFSLDASGRISCELAEFVRRRITVAA